MSVMSVATQHQVFSSYAGVPLQRQSIAHPSLHAHESELASMTAAALLATKEGQHAAVSIAATDTENKAHQFDRNTTSQSFAPGAGGAGGSGLLDSDSAPIVLPETARAEPDQIGGMVDVYL